MKRKILITFILFCFTATNCLAGFSSYQESFTTDTAVAPVFISDQGVFNLVVRIQFLHELYDKKPYTTNNYKKYIDRLSVEWSDIATQHILSGNIRAISEIEKLKSSIQAAIEKRAESLKSHYALQQEDEVVYAITGFYLSKPE